MASFLILIISYFFCLGIAADCGGRNISYTIIVSKQDKSTFTTIQAAVDSIKNNNDEWVKIHIKADTYMLYIMIPILQLCREKVQIPKEKPCIILEGEGRQNTMISYSDHNGTSSSSIFISWPPNVILSDITFKNWFDLMGSQSIQPAPAAAIYGDKSVFFKCGFISYQDTLFDEMGRHYFKDCYIQGEVDFIYGGGQSYYEACTINATKTKNTTSSGFVTAQCRFSESDPSGFVFRSGCVTGIGEVNLGRAWGPYSRVIFYGTYFSSIVTPQGWDSWDYAGQESKLTYAEVDCFGPGANTSERVQWGKKLSNSQLNEFSLSSFINQDEWLSNLPVKF
ncbi:hypothetical protein Fmac_030588 [Flemingia macrophylla]|uniref:pectinesterase n=1 Tax=Flemingia macrophylla TaxID=520843 RepID=A0ABD1KZL4_9FABA